MALPINIEDLLNKRIPCPPDFMCNVLVDVQVDVQVEPAVIERITNNISKPCPSYVLVMPKSILEKLAICLLRCKNEVSGHDMLENIDTTSYKQRKRKYLDKLMEMGLIRMTKPQKPTASDQRYVCTDLGRELIGK